MQLLTEEQLIWSPVVANNRMNRKRQASGVNSYEQDLSFMPEVYLNRCLEQQGYVKWLDLCCGEGNALLQYAKAVTAEGRADCVTLTGIDLVDQFQPIPPFMHCLQFKTGSLVNWAYEEQYDLITCVHGFHYIGDKLKALANSLRAISNTGTMIANLDINSIKIAGDNSEQYLKKVFRENDMAYNARKKVLQCTGPRNIDFGLVYKGANDKAGPNYTGQDAVDSYYQLL